MAAQNIHLKEAVASSDKPLREDEVVERRGTDVRHAMSVALDGDGRGEARQAKFAIDLRQRVGHDLLGPMARGKEGNQREDEQCGNRDRKNRENPLAE